MTKLRINTRKHIEYFTPQERHLREMRITKFPDCHGHNPTPGCECPPLEEIKAWLKEKNIKYKTKPEYNELKEGWECRTCIWLDDF